MIIQNRLKVSRSMVHSCKKRLFLSHNTQRPLVTVASLASGLLVFLMILIWFPDFPVIKIQPDKKLPLSYGPFKIFSGSEGKPVPNEPEGISVSEASVFPSSGNLMENPTNSSPIYGVAESTPSLSHSKNHLPLMLGKVFIQPDETLGELMQKTYGKIDEQHLELISIINPHIENLNSLKAGDIIDFPATHVWIDPPKGQYYWVEIGKEDDLEKALYFIRSYPGNIKSIQQEGFRISIVLVQNDHDELSAKERLNKLPPSLSKRGKVVSLWNKETVYFANPFVYYMP
jgi:hypothetical protein